MASSSPKLVATDAWDEWFVEPDALLVEEDSAPHVPHESHVLLYALLAEAAVLVLVVLCIAILA